MASNHIIFLGILEEVLSIDKFQKEKIKLKNVNQVKNHSHSYSEVYNQRENEVENLIFSEGEKALQRTNRKTEWKSYMKTISAYVGNFAVNYKR